MASQTLTLSTWAARRRPDEDIFARTLRGDPVAFSEVYRRYQKRIYGYCLARSLDPGTAADATQEVFMRLLRADPGSIDNPRAWLFTVARNVVIDVGRKRARTPEDVAADDDSLAWDRLKAADTADEVLERSDARNVFLALRSLRPRYRTALVMREIHGESAKDMADALETTPGAIDTLVSRARDAFGAAYAAVGDLPSACRASIELIYRSHGSGITAMEKAALQDHLASCDRCRTEAKRADSPRHLAALLPFLIPARQLGRGLLQRAAMTVRSVPDVAMQQAPVVLAQPQTWNLGAKIAAGLVAAAIITAPVVATTVRNTPSPRANRSVTGASMWSAPGSNAMNWGGTWMSSGGTWSAMRTGSPSSDWMVWSGRWYQGQMSSTVSRPSMSGSPAGGSAGTAMSGAWSSGGSAPAPSSGMSAPRTSGSMSSGSKTGSSSRSSTPRSWSSGSGSSMGSSSGGW